jgi:hypothetical protein
MPEKNDPKLIFFKNFRKLKKSQEVVAAGSDPKPTLVFSVSTREGWPPL